MTKVELDKVIREFETYLSKLEPNVDIGSIEALKIQFIEKRDRGDLAPVNLNQMMKQRDALAYLTKMPQLKQWWRVRGKVVAPRSEGSLPSLLTLLWPFSSPREKRYECIVCLGSEEPKELFERFVKSEFEDPSKDVNSRKYAASLVFS